MCDCTQVNNSVRQQPELEVESSPHFPALFMSTRLNKT